MNKEWNEAEAAWIEYLKNQHTPQASLLYKKYRELIEKVPFKFPRPE
jgi:hypothetical protein